MAENKCSKKPLVAFLPPFNNFGDTSPLVQIAKKYMERGGEAIFIGEEGKYEKLAKDIGCRIVRIRTNIPEKLSKERIKLKYKVHHEKITPEKSWPLLLKQEQMHYIEVIDKKVKAFKDEGVKLAVTNFFFTSLISARVTNIPLVFLTSGVAAPPYFESNYATFPDNYENFLTRLFPQSIKNRLTNWYALRYKLGIRIFNRLARKYKVPTLKRLLDLFSGDYTLIADDINFLNLKPTPEFPLENYVGPILSGHLFEHNDKQIDSEIEGHIKRPGRSILVSLGSSGTKGLFLGILKALNKANYNVIAVYATILNKDEIPKLNDNILLKKIVPSIKKVNEIVDLAIIHGGLGTVYTAAYSGKPVIGIPKHSEQQYNLDNLVRHGMAIRLSKKYFKEKKLLDAINMIFDNYDEYLKNAQLLKKKLQEPKGAENAAKRILEIVMHDK